MTTTTAPESDPSTDDQLVTVPLDRLAPHPDNVRSSLGDLADLTRSLKGQGVLVPLLVLPADEDGVHLIVAGHRRHAGAAAAGVSDVPVIVRDLSNVQVLDAMLVENSQRSDLGVADSIRAVARYQLLAPEDSPTKIGRRIGRTPNWVKTRLALAALPVEVLDRLDRGELTIERAAALAAVVDLGDAAVLACADHLAARRWSDDPASEVTAWRERHDADAKLADTVARLDRLGVHRFDTDHDARTAKARPLGDGGLGLDRDGARAHRHEPCHTVVVSRRWDNKVIVTGYCTEPRRHRATSTRSASSEIVVPEDGARPDTAQRDTERARRAARSARRDAAVVALGKARLPRTASLELAAHTLIHTARHDATDAAARFLGVTAADQPAATTLAAWLDDGGDPARLLAAIAGAELETRGPRNDPLPGGPLATAVGRWLDLLVAHAGYSITDSDHT